MATKDYVEVNTIFSSLSSTEMKALVSSSVEKKYKTDDVIVSEGEHAESFYIIKKGRVEITRGSNHSRLAILFDGD